MRALLEMNAGDVAGYSSPTQRLTSPRESVLKLASSRRERRMATSTVALLCAECANAGLKSQLRFLELHFCGSVPNAILVVRKKMRVCIGSL